MSFFNEKEVKELRETINVVISLEDTSADRKDFLLYIIPPLYKKVEKNIIRFKDGSIGITPTESYNSSQEILDFCFDNKCSASEVYFALSIRYLSHNPLMQKLTHEIVRNIKNPTVFDICTALIPNGLTTIIPQYHMESLKTDIKNYLDITLENPKAYQEMLDNSYQEIKKIIVERLEKTDTVIPMKIESNKVEEETDHQQEILNDMFTSKGIMGSIKKDTHFLSPLLKDTLIITDDNKVIFGNFTNALGIGFTDKAIQLGMDNPKTLKQLKLVLDSYINIESILEEDYEKTIQFIRACIQFIEDTNPKYIPFKKLSKELGMTKNQVKNFCKYVFDVKSIRLPKQFDNYKSFPHNIK